MMSADLWAVIERVKVGNRDGDDIEAIAAAIASGKLLLTAAPGSVGIGGDVANSKVVTGNNNVTGDRNIVIYGADAQTIQSVLNQHSGVALSTTSLSVDDLVQQVRSRLHDDIQRLHGTMPLWGVDYWVPLGELFVDVNILEEVSSNRRSELADLWQDFSQNPGYRGLDRIGLGKERQRVSGLEVLARNTNLMVVGKPGSGKTTYLQRVVTECNAGNLQAHRIPVLIRLREFVEDGRGVDYAVERYLERCWRLSAVEVQWVLEAGRSLVLLDGLDEVTGVDGQAIAKQIKRFARDYPQMQVIVTCRTQSQESRFERFDYVEVADFNEPQVRAFAEHWFQTVCGDLAIGQAKAKALLKQLFRDENKPIRELAITPILLSLTCAVFQQTGKFYSKRSKLYEEGLELLLEQWDKSREIERDGIYRDLSVERKLELLSYLAVKKFEQEQYVLFEQAEIEGYIAEFLGIGLRESRGVLRAIEAQHGLLIERSQKIWSFSHLTFQEYLVANWFSNWSDWLNLAKHIIQTYWKEVFLLTVEISLNISPLLHLMKTETDRLLANDDELQKFLVWVDEKSKSVDSPYSYSILRAFYYDLTIGLQISLQDAAKLAYNTALDSDFSLTLNSCPEFVLNLDLDCDAQFTSNTFDLDSDYLLSCALCLIIDRAIEIVYEACNSSQMDNQLKRQLQDLLDELPEKEEEFDKWLGESEPFWFEELRSIVITHRNIGHYWQLDEVRIDLLEKYYHANKLLVQCISQSEILNTTVGKEIEEVLLLPIAQIEKHKHEKIESGDFIG
jgi:predicted NACHT family NTPase